MTLRLIGARPSLSIQFLWPNSPPNSVPSTLPPCTLPSIRSISSIIHAQYPPPLSHSALSIVIPNKFFPLLFLANQPIFFSNFTSKFLQNVSIEIPPPDPNRSIFPDNYAVIVLKVFHSPMSPIPSPTFGGQRPSFRRQPTLSQYVQSVHKRKDPPDRRKYCGFDLHILHATQLAALTGLFFGLLRLTFWCLDPGQDLDRLGSFLHNLAFLCAHGLLFCALSLQMASLCLPFLLVNPISLFLLLRFMSRLFTILSEWPLLDTILGIGPLAAAMPEEDRQLASLSIRLSLLWLLILGITVSLLCWLQWVIFRTFLFIREMAKKQREKEVYRNVYFMDPRKTGKRDFY